MAFCFFAHCSATLRSLLSSLTTFHPSKLFQPSHLVSCTVAPLSMHTMSLAMLPHCRSLAFSESALRPVFRFSWTGLPLQSLRSHQYYVASPKLGRGEGCGRQQGHAYVTRREASELAFASESEGASFLADPSITWRSLGLSEDVAKALVQAALPQPSLVQAASIPEILSTRDVILAAETGSGKTHAYLAPLIQKLYETPEEVIEVENQTGEKSTRRPHRFGLVMCPNALLCQQVADMANVLQSTGGDPLIRVVVICGGQGWPSSLPDLVVATPAALMNNLFAFDADRQLRSAFVRDVRYVVLDEADMLLGGGFVRQVGRLIDLFRLEEKRKFKDMELKKIQERRKKQEEIESQKDYMSITEADDDVVAAKEEDEVFLRSDWTEEQEEQGMPTDSDQVDSFSGRLAEIHRRDEWLRARKEYKRSKQYIFVAATLPQGGKLSPGALLKQKFRNASWVNGHLLHRQNPRLEHRWLEVTEDKRIPTLIDAVSESGRLNNFESMGRTLVFANSVESVDAIGRVLERAGFKCMRYHRDFSLNERTEALQVFEQNGGLLICTDSAARGLDIPNISHVMQAEFATSAVDFLHRIGRTARAGQPGLVTSLYTAANRHLVEAVRETVTLALPVEGAFSRKRSFRRKIKKYGSFQGDCPQCGTERRYAGFSSSHLARNNGGWIKLQVSGKDEI